MTTIVTGGAGFIGSEYVRRRILAHGDDVVNVDALTYAASETRLRDVAGLGSHRLERADVADRDRVRGILRRVRPALVVHFAAESHVTRSEADPDRFYRSNVEGTRVLLEEAARAAVDRFVHVSTDEVYGPIEAGAFGEDDKQPGDVQATSPYARSKALADDLARSFRSDLDVLVVRPTNAFGPWQFPEKAFPRWVTRALTGQPLLVWGDGLYVRQWLHVEDLCRAIDVAAASGTGHPVYNIGPRIEPEITNAALATWIASYLGITDDRVVHTEYDRPNHDRRYALDAGRLEALGWRPSDPWDRFAEAIEWYRANRGWWEPLVPHAEEIYIDSPS